MKNIVPRVQIHSDGQMQTGTVLSVIHSPLSVTNAWMTAH